MVDKLIAEEGSLKGTILELPNKEQFILGRDPEVCDIALQDPKVSRQHASFSRVPEGLMAENLSEVNPVLINEESFDSPRLMHHGDRIKIGSSWFRFYAAEANSHPDEETAPQDNTPSILEENEPADSIEAPPIPEEDIDPDALPFFDLEEEDEERGSHQDTIFKDIEEEDLSQVHLEMIDSGRWLLKVISGTNTGAEFSMEEEKSYLLGTDAEACNLVFYDASISRKHARIQITQDETISIEDLSSRNGTLVDSKKIEGCVELHANQLVTIGTTTFIVIDRESANETIVSPLPSLPQAEPLPEPKEALEPELTPEPELSPEPEEIPEPETSDEENLEAEIDEPVEESAPEKEAEPEEDEKQTEETDDEAEEPEPDTKSPLTKELFRLFGSFKYAFLVLSAIIILLFFGIGSLFKSSDVPSPHIDYTKQISKIVSQYPAVEFSYTKSNGTLFLLGHILTPVDYEQLSYQIKQLHFVKDLKNHTYIDEGIWQEMNQILTKAGKWRGVTVHSPKAGSFVMTGYLKTRSEADTLTNYVNLNFPHLDRLENLVVVEENIIDRVSSQLFEHGFVDVVLQINNGSLTLTGFIGTKKHADYNALLKTFENLTGVRSVKNFVVSLNDSESMINLTDNYKVTGSSSHDNSSVNVVINGRILVKGDNLDGMKIIDIQPKAIYLEKDGVKYKIDYNK